MAELDAAVEARTLSGAALASEQLRAIAWLRWRILANGFRRKGGAGELIARILLLPLFGAVALLPTVLAGVFAWYFATRGELRHVGWVLWGAVALTQLLNINMGQPGTTFDPVELVRFPLPLRRYVLVRLCFGLLSPANVIVSMMSVAVVVGLTVAHHRTFLPALVAMTVFALSNVLFTRMIFAWVDRWLSTRRAREFFTACIFLLSIGFQVINVRFNPGFQHHGGRHNTAPDVQPMRDRLHRAHPYVAWLPPELIASAIVAESAGETMPFLEGVLGCACFGALFLAIYTARMRTEYRGENLSDAANAVRRPAARALSPATPPAGTPPEAIRASRTAERSWLLSTLVPLLGKELLVLRRNVGLFYGLIAPAVMVFLFAGRLSTRNSSHWVLLGSVAYALLGISALSYNSFGAEGTGAQFYFFAPVPLREVFLAKNLFGLALATAEVLVVLILITYVAGRPTLADAVFVSLWALGTLLLNTTMGNLRSISAPKRINPGRTMRKAQSAVSGYIAMALLAGCTALGFGCQLLAAFLHQPWVGLTLMAAFAAVGTVVYAQGLRGIENYALNHRDTLFEELGKKT